MLELTHNFDPTKFKWLWAKYVTGFDESHHCTNSIRGYYSRNFSKHNPLLRSSPSITLGERPPNAFDAIYICGVSSRGYSVKLNYPHNVHAAIVPESNEKDEWAFEGWRMSVRGGRFQPIPSLGQLPERHRELGDEFTTCRIFRWAACFYQNCRRD
jgi:hypothetical protein